MINVPLKNMTISAHFSFFAAVSLMILLNGGFVLLGLYACLIHETGHLTAMFMTGQKAKRVIFYGAGIKIIQEESVAFTPFMNELFVLTAGIFANVLVFVAMMFSGNTLELRLFGFINLMTALFNLLPLSTLDGGRIIATFLYKFCGYQRATMLEKYLSGINILLGFAIAAFFILLGNRNFTLYLTLAYLMVSEVCILYCRQER